MKRVAITGFLASCYGGNDTVRRWDTGSASWEGTVVPAKTLSDAQSLELSGTHEDVRRGLLNAGLLREPAGTPVSGADRTGVCIGTSKADFTRWPESGISHPDYPPFSDHRAMRVAERFEAGGPCLAPVAACATGAHALALGAQLIEDDRADAMICGAFEPRQNEFLIGGYRNLGALSKTGVMRPFDRTRDGFVPGWGGGYVFLENEAHARARGAQIHGFLTGYSLKCDATHMTAMCPGGETIARAIEDAMRRAGCPRIDYINAHGTATKLNDATESRGIELALGRQVPVSSTKPVTGHLLGAAGVVEAIICLLALRDNFAPPTLNLESPDEELHLDYLPYQGRALAMNTVLSLNYGFGGHIGALIFQKA